MQCQAATFSVQYNPSSVLSMALSTSKKGLICDLYSILQMVVSTQVKMNYRQQWQKDLTLLDDQWQQAQSLFLLFPFPPLNCLFYIVHYMPHRLYSWGRSDSPNCSRLVNTGTLINTVWRCPKLHCYWTNVFSNTQ